MKKITLELSKSIVKRVHRIQQRMELKSEIVVITNAISVYEMLTNEVACGNRVVIINETGDETEVDIR